MTQLRRSKKNRIIAGVCGGLAEYFNVDPTIVRLIWVLVSLLWGAGIALYLIAWIITPEEEGEPVTVKPEIKEKAKTLVGGLLIILGILFLVSLVVPKIFTMLWKLLAASVLILAGLIFLLRRSEK